jgi:hypothetical protein
VKEMSDVCVLFFLNKEKRVKMKCLPVSARMGLTLQSVRNVISGSPDQETDPRPDRGRLPFMAVGPLSRSATIKGGQAGAREPTFTVPTVPPQTLTT